MRAGGNCAVQQALTADAAAVVKQAVVLARRRGHPQVTPLHVANTMLAAGGGAFRLACLESHSHPLQCKALELCFNVALNRLPASSPAAATNPSISNALVAAFKRAQAHQRRGSMESQQQPLLAIKIELEQLIISILDDPSVSRVMREAGFSSTQVKINVEKTTSLELRSPSSPITKENSIPTNPRNEEDLKALIETLIIPKNKRRRRRSIALVGECTATLESTVRALMDRVERGEVPEPLKEVKFINIPPLSTFSNLGHDEVEMKVRELTCLVQSLVGKGVVLYLGDLKWISDYRVSLEREGSYYCSVEHMIMEIGRLVWGIGESERFWVIGIATFQTYMRCKSGYHSLQTVWGIHPLTIPLDSLAFALVSESEEENGGMRKPSCCVECWEKFESEARDLETSANERALSRLPSWLKDESRRLNENDQKGEEMKELCKKWSSYCNSAHKKPTPSSLTTLQLLSSSSSEDADINPQKFKDFNAENLNLLCNALEAKVPWQKQIIPEIAGTILQCRSGMMRRKIHGGDVKEDTWLLFLGRDENQAKEKMARELARVVFGSYSRFQCIGLSRFADSWPPEECRSKRGRDEGRSYVDRMAAAAAADPRRVFLVEDLEQADYCSQMGIKRAIEKGTIVGGDGDEVGFCDAIVILSCESFSSRSRASSPAENGGAEEEGGGGGVCLDLNVSLDAGGAAEDRPVDELGVLENVDRKIVFKIQDLR